jgi:hypothetical protein
MSKNSRDSKKHDMGCNEQCPLLAASKAVAINDVQPLAAAMFGVSELQPFHFAYAASNDSPIYHPAPTSPPTLLSLGCALTV